MFADELNQLGCVLRDDASQDTAITVPGLLEQVRQRKFIECFQGSVRIELFVPAVPLQEEILRRAVIIKLGVHDVPVTTAEDLILLKLAFHRVKDMQDVRGMLWVQRGKLNLDYLDHWTKQTLRHDSQKELQQLVAEYSRDKSDDLPV